MTATKKVSQGAVAKQLDADAQVYQIKLSDVDFMILIVKVEWNVKNIS